MTDSSVPADCFSTPNAEKQGIPEIRQKAIAALLARGFSVKYVAKKLRISESRIYHLFSEKNSLLNAEIHRILNDAFAASDRRLIDLYDKALQKLDSMLSSSDEEKQFRAIDRIIKIYLSRSAKNAVTIEQYFGIESQEEKETIDEMILRMRKERGLPELPDHKDSSHSTPNDSSNSSPNNLLQMFLLKELHLKMLLLKNMRNFLSN